MQHFCLKNFTEQGKIPVSVRNSPHAENTAPHTHDFVEIVFIRAGHALHQLHDKEGNAVLSNSIIKGDVFTVLPGEIHSYSRSCMFRNYNLCVGRELMEELAAQLQTLEYFDTFFSPTRPVQINQLHLTPMDFLAVEQLIKRLTIALHCDPDSKSRPTAIKLLLMEIFMQVFDGFFKGWKQYPAYVSENFFLSIERLEKFPARRIELSKLAKEVGMSLSGYAHKFKEIVGVSPSEYINLLRLENAKKQLEETSLSLFEIAAQNGFSSDNYFIRMFKKRYGITPKRYRLLCSGPADPA